MRQWAVRLSGHLAALRKAFLETTDDALARCCWVVYGAVAPAWALLLANVLLPAVIAAMIALMGFAYWRLHDAPGTIYASHFENAVFCMAAALSIYCVGQIIVPALGGVARQVFLLAYMIPLIWSMERLATGAFMLRHRRTVAGADAS